MNLHPSTDIVFVMSTCESIAQAEILTSEILEARIAACVTSIPGALSTYWWQGKLEKSQEIVLMIKTVKQNLLKLEQLFQSHHPYELPELVVLPVADGSEQYLDWVRMCCGN